MVAVWQSVAYNSRTLGADPVVTKPAGTVDGDLLIAVGVAGGTDTITAQAGGAAWIAHPDSISTTYPLWYKIAASEPADYTFNTSGTANSIVVISRWTGFNPAAPFDAVAGINGTALNYVIPSVTSAGPNRKLAQMGARVTASITFTGPASQTERWDANAPSASFTTAGGDEVVGAGATGTRTWTASASNNPGVFYSLAIAPIPPKEGTFTGGYDFSGSFVGEAPPVAPGEGTFTGGFDFTGSFTGSAPVPGDGGGIVPGGRERFTARRTPKNRRRTR